MVPICPALADTESSYRRNEQDVKLTAHIHQVSRLRMHGAIPSFPHTCVWRGIFEQGQLNLWRYLLLGCHSLRSDRYVQTSQRNLLLLPSPWWQRQQVPLKRRHFATRLHVTSRRTSSWPPLVRVIFLHTYHGLFRLNMVLWVYTSEELCFET